MADRGTWPLDDWAREKVRHERECGVDPREIVEFEHNRAVERGEVFEPRRFLYADVEFERNAASPAEPIEHSW